MLRFLWLSLLRWVARLWLRLSSPPSWDLRLQSRSLVKLTTLGETKSTCKWKDKRKKKERKMLMFEQKKLTGKAVLLFVNPKTRAKR
jgi:hypothetical protein